MRNLVGIVAPALPRTERSEATRALQSGCRTLCSTSPDFVRSIQVILDLDELPVSLASATDFAQRIAMEYGVVARARAGEKRITVYLTRANAPEPHHADPIRNEVIRWVWHFFSWLSR